MIFYEMKNPENILIYDISYKTLIGAKPLYICLIKLMRLLEITMELNI